MFPEKSFFLLRHGETDYNLQNKTCGSTDLQLNEKGLQQASDVAKILKFLNKKCIIFHSALTRAKKTADIIAKANQFSMQEIPSLNEHHFGEWEGVLWNDVITSLNTGQNPPGGESRDEYINRVKLGFQEIMTITPLEFTPFIVAHGGTFYALARIYNHQVVDIQNCQLVFFRYSVTYKTFPWETFLYYITDNNISEVREDIFFIENKNVL